MERAWNRPVVRPKRVPREVERMQRAARYHQQLTDRGQSVYELAIDEAGNYKTVKRPKSREDHVTHNSQEMQPTDADADVLHFPPIIGGSRLTASPTAAA